jgi:hypothetical protein
MFLEALTKDLVEEYQSGLNRNKETYQRKVFHHVTNYVSRTHEVPSDDDGGDLLPAAHSDVSISR